jgi:hypothetical protein
MPTKTYELVTVTMQNGKLKCAPDWVHLYWKDGPGDIRWAFRGVRRSEQCDSDRCPTKYETPLKARAGSGRAGCTAPQPTGPRGSHHRTSAVATPKGGVLLP